MQVTVLAFARLRELLGGSRELVLSDGSNAGDVWASLPPESCALRVSTRIARNGVVVADAEPLADGDVVALLPPVSGG